MCKTRCLRLLLLVGFLTFHWALFLVGRSEAARPNRPNIILLLTDDQRWDTLPCYGNSIVQTPSIDKLASQGIVFNNMFVTTSICASSRASIFTGQYVRRHGIWNFRTGLTQQQLALSYPGLLKKAGYRLGFIGKWGVDQPPKDLFDYNKGFAGQGKYLIEIDGKPRHLTAVMGDQALEFLNGSSPDTPFCLSISFKAAHVQDSYDLRNDPFPFDPALKDLYSEVTIPVPKTAGSRYYERLPAFLKNSENRMRWAVRFWGPTRYQDSVKGYYRLISGVDVVVGRILRRLEEKGFAQNTIIIFTGDNGFYLGEYGFAGKWLPHEASIRVPLIIYDPRLPESQRGSRRDEMALSIDMAPTVLEMAGLDIPKRVQGRSLVPLLQGQKIRWRTEFFYEHLFEHPRIPPTEAVRTERWKYIRYIETDPLYEELYDLLKDPLEEHNLVPSEEHQEVVKKMRQKWRQWCERAR
ncbi:sulfatase [Acidobacteria bacterium AH-259-O06]|nr:sulfatase [Acidobacteria bacterium AH-259-O06]